MATTASDVLHDLEVEYDRIEAILDSLTEMQWISPSSAPGWTVADTVLHLALTEEGVVATLANPQAVWADRSAPLDDVIDDQVRSEVAPPAVVFERWRTARRAAIAALAAADPDTAVRWAAAPLRPRTLATTRLAEHWAHTLDITEPLELRYPDTDRLRHIAWLGHATLPYAMRLAGLDPASVCCTLTAPSGSVYRYGPTDADSTVTGEMGAFCRVGARRLTAGDSGLTATGPAGDDTLRVLRNYAA
ncbi:MAG: maleylpyruvate isomerase family mycothiol-dependent enzyme [Actinomycetia bacterium]|nr:maleylpyruvate isomerase family mycothiol-dependent enzyme [Actinomycetes bacterium]